MSILKPSMQQWDILAFLIALSVGIAVAANGGVSIQNTSSNVRTNMTGEVSTGKTVSEYSYPAVIPRAPKATTNATRPNVTTPEVVAYKVNNTKITTSSVTTKISKDITRITQINTLQRSRLSYLGPGI